MVEMYSREIKHYAMMIYRKEKSLRKVQYLLEISKSTISRWKNLLTHDEKKKNKSNEDNQPVIIDTINFISKTNHSFSIRDIQQHLKCKLGITCSYELIRCVIKNKMKFSYKKTKYAYYIDQNILKQKTDAFKTQFKAKYNINSPIYFIDEVGFSSKQLPLYSWSKKGVKTYVSTKLNNKTKKNKSVCACISFNGQIKYSIQNTPYETNTFLEFIKSLNLRPNSILIMDNARFHHAKYIKSYCEQRKLILIYTPPYSPWFNPIENVFSVIKHHYKKNKNIEDAFSAVSNTTIINCIKHSLKRIYD